MRGETRMRTMERTLKDAVFDLGNLLVSGVQFEE